MTLDAQPERTKEYIDHIREDCKCSSADSYGSSRMPGDFIAEGGTSWVFVGFGGNGTRAVKIAKKPEEISNEQAQRYIGNHPELLRQETNLSILFHAVQRMRNLPEPRFGADLPRGRGGGFRIVGVGKYGITDNGRPYIEMDKVRTSSVCPSLEALCAIVRGGVAPQCTDEDYSWRKPRAPPTVHRALTELLMGVKDLHDIKLLHRDLKPSNVLYTYEGDEEWFAKICDLQTLVRLDKRAEYLGPSHGSRYFCSPEQARNAQVEDVERYGMPLRPSSDIYAVGCCMLCLVGKARRETLPDAEHKRDLWAFEAIMGPLLKTVRPEYADIVRKATAYAPEDRYQSADEMLNYVKSVGGGQA